MSSPTVIIREDERVRVRVYPEQVPLTLDQIDGPYAFLIESIIQAWRLTWQKLRGDKQPLDSNVA